MRNIVHRLGWALAGALAIAVIAIGARDARGGPLDPPGPPGPTLQSLSQMPPDWSQQLVANDGTSCASSRFECVMLEVNCTTICFFAYKGVLDHETGLVWQRDPSANDYGNWAPAVDACYSVTLGGRSGWRPATLPELMTLFEYHASPAPSLPAGHPFQNVASAPLFWTATLYPDSTTQAYLVNFVDQYAGNWAGKLTFPKNAVNTRAWCVRGADTQ
jgi:hypothetical protein